VGWECGGEGVGADAGVERRMCGVREVDSQESEKKYDQVFLQFVLFRSTRFVPVRCYGHPNVYSTIKNSHRCSVLFDLINITIGIFFPFSLIATDALSCPCIYT
jgi:hypothetical protein